VSASLLKRRSGVAAQRAVGRARRHFRVRKNINGTLERPRLVVTRSLRQITAQIVDDTKGHTLISASSLDASIRGTEGTEKPFGGADKKAVAAKVGAGELIAVETLEGIDGKTKALVTRLAALGAAGTPTLLVVASLEEPLRRASRNVPWLTVEPPSHVSVYQLLRARRVVIERTALMALEEALAP